MLRQVISGPWARAHELRHPRQRLRILLEQCQIRFAAADAFEQLQKAAMDGERRRFDENSLAIERALRDGDRKVPVR